MRDRPLVSVIIPVYNSEQYLRESIESIINQTYCELEIIIIDDFSTDSSLNIITEYQQKDKRIKIISNDKNLNSARCRNIGISVSTGELICLQDSDDISRLDRIEKQVEILRDYPNIAAVGSNIVIIDGQSKIIGKRKYPSSTNDIRKTMTLYCPIAQPTMMIKQNVLHQVGHYNEKYSRAQDYDLWFRILEKFDVINLDEYLVFYRRHTNQGLANQTKQNYNYTLEIQTKYLLHKKFISLKSILIFPLKYCMKYLPSKVQIKLLNIFLYNI